MNITRAIHVYPSISGTTGTSTGITSTGTLSISSGHSDEALKWLSSAVNPRFVSGSAWGLDKYADFEMPFDMLAQSWPTVFLVVALYLLIVWQWTTGTKPLNLNLNLKLNNLMKAKKHSGLDMPTCRHAWNSLLALYSILGSMHMLAYLANRISTQGLYAAFCGPDDSFDQGPVGFWFLLFVLGKVVELGDTLFLMAAGKKVIFLHWFHHSTILPCCWYALQAKIPMFRACATINYTVHAIMYSYFALNDTTLCQDNPSFRYTWAQRITTIQCTQFVICLNIIATGLYDRIMYQNSDIPYTSVILSSFILGSYLYLFLQFAEEKYAYRSQLRRSILQFYLKFNITIGRITAGSNFNKPNNNDNDNTPAPWNRTDCSLEERFQEATKMAAMLYGAATEEDLENMYGCYKQAREGPVPTELLVNLKVDSQEQPLALQDEKTLTKLRAWKSVRDLSKEQAQEKYIAIMDVLRERSQASTEKTKQRRRAKQQKSTNHTQTTTNTAMLYPVRIAGHGRYLPRNVLNNQDIEKLGGFELSSQEKKRTGVQHRHFVDVDGGDESLVQNGARAVRAACAKAGINVEDLDLIIGGFGGHQVLPDDASLVQRELGLGESGIRAFTVHATCLSFVVAMEVAGSFMRDGKYQKVAVFASSISSVGIYKSDPHTAGLFGDGAAAVILEPASLSSSSSSSPSSNSNGNSRSVNDPGIHGAHMETYGIGADTCRIKGGGNNCPHFRPDYDERWTYFEMDGQATLSLVSKYAPAALHNFMPGLERGLNNLQLPGCENDDERVDVDWVVPHQASAVAVDSLTMFGWPEEKILKTLHKYGNCVAASIPLTLCDGIDNGTIKRGDRVLLCGTSAGLSCASMLLTY